MISKSSNTKLDKEVADLLLSIGAVTFRFDPPYTFTSGLKSPIYLDNRMIMSYPEVREKIVAAYIQILLTHIRVENVNVLSGTATAAIPQTAWIAEKLNLPMVYVRPKTKEHGKEKQIEGTFPKGSKVVIIEDHISTGASSITNARVIRSEGGKAEYCIATTTYETKASIKNFRKGKIKLIALTTGKHIVNEAEKRKMLTTKEAKLVHDWLKDPVSWYKKHYG
ncbi:orotate phosphoribosyltransferase [Candidatus Roizmanbacteria bacterium RIFCSPLOWO2_02_FULL_37_19]|uniref:Orotate phosphoribosyltransferase n=1 Tax=Candidatus Roizmanbacteria bacterium RIFCSPHIGHO2_02_FULL_37_24 TaxID=1802037 RepID=A0A1F7GX27_9BACT|nr:MAG: orotate phosphoribosyltransferase [Candidatus Roizmanbacteria bacterium RIFCSPHIGHO2_01_FULL_38_41]OGK23385.1 MAG: orotate phosphoribosyltransferase [Candidatus Roizmanbacteria bacterium RIFCSPHIGHO2_02_FULL_37_24]OGK33193.1 MAG: orotate phosphoribosyltransferase [Candidatus Roizmanbacteria bacterium RIFCSPHIGHO2_12_FULL_37_23]OGK43499.1 MAG: orotate phosphoribosyltransferase [Candidatus Roizmanbacteria bacterium RIFCSPLOWO2_01_FULL_37_57]OGK54629.1 MAG: orotate phosphoribosyltransferas